MLLLLRVFGGREVVSIRVIGGSGSIGIDGRGGAIVAVTAGVVEGFHCSDIVVVDGVLFVLLFKEGAHFQRHGCCGFDFYEEDLVKNAIECDLGL